MYYALLHFWRANGSAVMAMLFVLIEAIIFYIIGKVEQYAKMRKEIKYHLPDMWKQKLKEKDVEILELQKEIEVRENIIKDLRSKIIKALTEVNRYE